MHSGVLAKLQAEHGAHSSGKLHSGACPKWLQLLVPSADRVPASCLASPSATRGRSKSASPPAGTVTWASREQAPTSGSGPQSNWGISPLSGTGCCQQVLAPCGEAVSPYPVLSRRDCAQRRKRCEAAVLVHRSLANLSPDYRARYKHPNHVLPLMCPGPLQLQQHLNAASLVPWGRVRLFPWKGRGSPGEG